MLKRNCVLVLVLSYASSLPVAVMRAQEEPQSGVARVSLTHGDVSSQRGDSGDWVATVVNTPLVPGDTVATGSDSRTEIQLDHSNVLRLDQQAQVKIADLTSSHIQLQVIQGEIDFVILRHTETEVEIDTPTVAVHPFGDGVYRLRVNPDSASLVVRRGEAEVSSAEGSTTVHMDQMIQIQGADQPEYQVVEAPERDGWDEWNQNRDHELLEAESWHHANHYYTGASDLDRHGHWVRVPGYDWCWTPYVDMGWVPYRDGRWVWEPGWGWTWVSYEPWGWAPYHYGRWFPYGDGWVWWPGPPAPAYRPVYAPAYVSFFGFGFGGRNWSFGFGYGYQSVGWLPVGPSDPYYPWAGRRNTYNTVNVTNITNITNVTNVTNVQNVTTVAPLATTQPARSNLQAATNNAQVRRAITSTTTEDFVKGRIPRQPQPVDVATLRQAHLVQGTVPAVPTAESLKPVDRPVNPAAVPARAANTQRFFATTPPPPAPRPFAEHAAEVRQMVQQQNPLQPGTRRPAVTPGASQPPRGAGQVEGQQGGESTATRPGFRKFGEPGPGATSRTAPEPSANRPARPVREENVQEERTPASHGVAPASSRHEGAPPVTSDERSRRNVSPSAGRAETPERREQPESANPARPASRPGWRRFGDEGSRPRSQEARPRPAEHEPERKDQREKEKPK